MSVSQAPSETSECCFNSDSESPHFFYCDSLETSQYSFRTANNQASSKECTLAIQLDNLQIDHTALKLQFTALRKREEDLSCQVKKLQEVIKGKKKEIRVLHKENDVLKQECVDRKSFKLQLIKMKAEYRVLEEKEKTSGETLSKLIPDYNEAIRVHGVLKDTVQKLRDGLVQSEAQVRDLKQEVHIEVNKQLLFKEDLKMCLNVIDEPKALKRRVIQLGSYLDEPPDQISEKIVFEKTSRRMEAEIRYDLRKQELEDGLREERLLRRASELPNRIKTNQSLKDEKYARSQSAQEHNRTRVWKGNAEFGDLAWGAEDDVPLSFFAGEMSDEEGGVLPDLPTINQMPKPPARPPSWNKPNRFVALKSNVPYPNTESAANSRWNRRTGKLMQLPSLLNVKQEDKNESFPQKTRLPPISRPPSLNVSKASELTPKPTPLPSLDQLVKTSIAEVPSRRVRLLPIDKIK